MRNFLIMLQILMASSVFAQTSPGGSTSLDTNQVVTFTEREDITYYLTDTNEINTIDHTELVTLEPRKKLRSYKHVWGASGYSHVEIKNSTPLNDGAHFEFPNTTIIVKNGTLERKDEAGSVFMRDTMKVDTMRESFYKARRVFNTSPIVSLPVGYNFVPQMDRGTQDFLTTNGYTITGTYPNNLSVANDWTKTKWDNSTKTITTTVNDPTDKEMIEEINTIYYSIVGDQLIKLKDVTQQFRRLHNGICFMEVSTKTYSGVANSIDNNIQQRSAKHIIQDKITVYPNPSRNEFILSPSDPNDKIEKVQIFDLAGKTIYFDISNSINGAKRVTIQSEQTGIYIIKYMILDKGYTQKIIKI